LTAITTFDVQDWLLELHEAGDYAAKTLNNALGVLVAALHSAAKDRLIPLNPAARVERLPLGHVERDWLRLNEIGLYMEACAPVYRPLAELLIGSGMRISEALGVRWDDVDFERQVIRVYRSARRDGDGPTASISYSPPAAGSTRTRRWLLPATGAAPAFRRHDSVRRSPALAPTQPSKRRSSASEFCFSTRLLKKSRPPEIRTSEMTWRSSRSP
jgi:integrase